MVGWVGTVLSCVGMCGRVDGGGYALDVVGVAVVVAAVAAAAIVGAAVVVAALVVAVPVVCAYEATGWGAWVVAAVVVVVVEVAAWWRWRRRRWWWWRSDELGALCGVRLVAWRGVCGACWRMMVCGGVW